jgi:hypothetical protein
MCSWKFVDQGQISLWLEMAETASSVIHSSSVRIAGTYRDVFASANDFPSSRLLPRFASMPLPQTSLYPHINLLIRTSMKSGEILVTFDRSHWPASSCNVSRHRRAVEATQRIFTITGSSADEERRQNIVSHIAVLPCG